MTVATAQRVLKEAIALPMKYQELECDACQTSKRTLYRIGKPPFEPVLYLCDNCTRYVAGPIAQTAEALRIVGEAGA